MSPNDSSSLLGRTIAGKFVVEALIATGGSGTVYRARQPALERTVALKVLHDDVAGDPHFVERFKREARAACRLDHRNSVRVLDFGQHDESWLYLAMEYVEGRTLFQVIEQEWPLADTRVVDIVSQVLSAVGAAHDMEVIHRDLKPENIMIIRGRSDEGESTELAKVCDFGIATLGAVVHQGKEVHVGGPSVTRDGFLVGTPAYMSPEQARGMPADRRSDLYSAGVVLYQMLARRIPFQGDSAYMVAMKHITDAVPPPSDFAPVNPALEAVCLRALRKDPRDRFSDAREMRAALRATVASSATLTASTESTPGPQPVRFKGPGTPPTNPGRRRANPRLVVGAVVLGLAIAALTTRGLLRPRRDVSLPRASATALLPSPSRSPSAPRPATTVQVGTAVSAPADRSATRQRTSPSRRQEKKNRTPPAPPAVVAPPPASPAVVAPPPAPPAVVAAPPPMDVVAPKPRAPLPAAARAVPLDIDRANVTVAAVTTTSAIPGSHIRAAVSRMPIVRCYRDALRASAAAASGKAMLHLRIDMDGYVTGAVLDGAAFLPSLKTCVEKVARTVRLRDVDTGEGTADVALTFVAVP
jgi:serine/threonine protein kinase